MHVERFSRKRRRARRVVAAAARHFGDDGRPTFCSGFRCFSTTNLEQDRAAGDDDKVFYCADCWRDYEECMDFLRTPEERLVDACVGGVNDVFLDLFEAGVDLNTPIKRTLQFQMMSAS